MRSVEPKAHNVTDGEGIFNARGIRVTAKQQPTFSVRDGGWMVGQRDVHGRRIFAGWKLNHG